MLIRELTGTDLDSLLVLYGFLHRQDDGLASRSVIEATWSDAVGRPGLCHMGGFVDEKLVTSCVLIIVPNLSRGCRPYALIENVVTHGDFRRRGLGSLILRAALDTAWRAGCYKVMLATGSRDEAVLRFYEGAGFDRHAKQAFVARPGPENTRPSHGPGGEGHPPEE